MRRATTALSHYERGLCLESPAPGAASAAYERALALDAQLADAHYNLARQLEAAGRASNDELKLSRAVRHLKTYRDLSRTAGCPHGPHAGAAAVSARCGRRAVVGRARLVGACGGRCARRWVRASVVARGSWRRGGRRAGRLVRAAVGARDGRWRGGRHARRSARWRWRAGRLARAAVGARARGGQRAAVGARARGG